MSANGNVNKRKLPLEVSHLLAQFYQDCVEGVNNLTDNTTGEFLSGPFLKLPSRKIYPDYYEIVSSPISISEIKQRSINTKRKPRQAYCDLNEFKDMWSLMKSNAAIYNSSDSLIVIFVNQIYDFVINEINKFEQEHQEELKLIIQQSTTKTSSALNQNQNQNQDDDDYIGPSVKKQKTNYNDDTVATLSLNLKNEGEGPYQIPSTINESQYISNLNYPNNLNDSNYSDSDLKKDLSNELQRVFKHLLSFKISHHKNSQPLSKPLMHLPNPRVKLSSNELSFTAPINVAKIDPEIYYLTTKSPMSFHIIQCRLESGVYSTGTQGLDRFLFDFQLMLDNILNIYKEGSTIWKCANGLQRALDKRWERLNATLKKSKVVAKPKKELYIEDEEEEEEEEEGDEDDGEEEEHDEEEEEEGFDDDGEFLEYGGGSRGRLRGKGRSRGGRGNNTGHLDGTDENINDGNMEEGGIGNNYGADNDNDTGANPNAMDIDELPQFIRKHEVNKVEVVEAVDDITAFLSSVTLKSLELQNNDGLLTHSSDSSFISTTIIEPAGNSAMGGAIYSIQLPSQAIIDKDILIELRLLGEIAGDKFQLNCHVNGEKLQGRIPSEYQIEETTSSFIARTMMMKIGYGLNLVEIDLHVGFPLHNSTFNQNQNQNQQEQQQEELVETCKLWINVTN